MQESEDVSKPQAQISALKYCVICEISILVQNVEQILESVNTAFSNLKQDDDKNTVMLEKSISFLQQELRSKDEIIKSLLDTQTIVLETISKQNQFKKEDKNLSDVP